MSTAALTRDYLKRAEAERIAAAAGLGPWMLRAAIERGELPARKVGRHVLIDRRDLEAWVATPGTDGAEPIQEFESKVR